jgi:lysozyme family protein
MTFDHAVELIFKHEGGYVNHPDDPGGETNYGISKRAYPDLDIAHLSKHDAAVIYKEDYWDKIRGDDLPYPLALATFDAAVNSGVRRASKWLQYAVGAKPTDGIVGNITVDIANADYGRNPHQSLIGCIHQRQQFIRSILTYKTFGKGWERRIEETYQEAKKWITETS